MGAIQNRAILTADYLRRNLKRKTIQTIANETGVTNRTVAKYIKIHQVKRRENVEIKEAWLARIINEIHETADKLQALYFQADNLRDEIRMQKNRR